MGQTEIALHWSELPPLPDKIGFAGPFAGAHNGVLIVGGGAKSDGESDCPVKFMLQHAYIQLAHSRVLPRKVSCLTRDQVRVESRP